MPVYGSLPTPRGSSPVVPASFQLGLRCLFFTRCSSASLRRFSGVEPFDSKQTDTPSKAAGRFRYLFTPRPQSGLATGTGKSGGRKESSGRVAAAVGRPTR